jgi:hypothetical protein
MRSRRASAVALIPVLIFVTLLTWAFASPIGAAPDDDYHLASAWCVGAIAEETCARSAGHEDTREISGELTDVACFAGDPHWSAACQDAIFDGDMTDDTVTSSRGNFSGLYPPLYYAAMSVFTSGDVQLSALLMRVFTITLFVGILTALYLLLPTERRPTLVIGWVVTTIPLGTFLLASNNPSAWATIGVGTGWLALLGYFETSGRRRIALGGLYAVAVLMAVGSRDDAAVYVGLTTILVLVYAFRRRGGFWWEAAPPFALGVVVPAVVLLSRLGQRDSVGLPGGTSTADAAADGPPLSAFGSLANNVMNVPLIWAGTLGEWGLGWLDTAMPAIVTFSAVMAFVMAGFLGIARTGRRKVIMVGAVVLALWLVPVLVLHRAGDLVGETLQPRHLLPLVVVLGGLLALDAPATRWRRGQLLVVVAPLTIAHSVALYVNLRRYLTGIDTGGLNLDVDAEWWWNAPFSPMFVWGLGTFAYAALLFLIVTRVLAPTDSRTLISHGVS